MKNLFALLILMGHAYRFLDVVTDQIEVLFLDFFVLKHIANTGDIPDNFCPLIDLLLEHLEQRIDEITPKQYIRGEEYRHIEDFVDVFGSDVAVADCRSTDQRPVH